MTAGRGIAHSERTAPEQRVAGSKVNGQQLGWRSLSTTKKPSRRFTTIRPIRCRNSSRRALASECSLEAPTGRGRPRVHSRSLFYVDVTMPAGCELPLPREHEERAVYVVERAVDCGAERAECGRVLVLAPRTDVRLRAHASSRVVLIGGAPIDGPRHIAWNFVSCTRERIERCQARLAGGALPQGARRRGGIRYANRMKETSTTTTKHGLRDVGRPPSAERPKRIHAFLAPYDE